MQAVFEVGVEASKSEDVLDGYAAENVQRDVCAWLSTGPHVRRCLAAC